MIFIFHTKREAAAFSDSVIGFKGVNYVANDGLFCTLGIKPSKIGDEFFALLSQHNGFEYDVYGDNGCETEKQLLLHFPEITYLNLYTKNGRVYSQMAIDDKRFAYSSIDIAGVIKRLAGHLNYLRYLDERYQCLSPA